MLRKSEPICRIITAFALFHVLNLAAVAQMRNSVLSSNLTARDQHCLARFEKEREQLRTLLKVPGMSAATISPDNPLKETLVNLEKQSWEAWKNRDAKFFQSFLSDDHVELGFGGPANKAAVVNVVGSPACVVKSYSVDRFELTVFDPNTALLTYHAAQDTTCGGKAVPSPVWASSLYIKRGDRWLNAVYQQTQANK